MTTTNPEPIGELVELAASTLGDAELVRVAVENAVTALQPITVGDHAIGVRLPPDWKFDTVDIRSHEDHPRERAGRFQFSSIESLVRYVNRFKTAQTLGYIKTATTTGITAATEAAIYVLDDFDPEASTVANRSHRAELVLAPTPAARRWGAAFSRPLSQEQMVELVSDGVTEIATPPAADLRDLLADLHAIRTTSAKSVIRTGGGVAVELAENVTLHAGPGNIVNVPSKLRLVLQPWTATPETIVLTVTIRPKVSGENVTFVLSCPELEDRLNKVVDHIADELANDTDIDPYRIP